MGIVQLHLAHFFSQTKVKFTAQKNDNMISQAIELSATLDEDIKVSNIRLKEWYGWHFPELAPITKTDHLLYARIVLLLMDRVNVTSRMIPHLSLITIDARKAREIVKIARVSLGQNITRSDLLVINSLAKRIVRLSEYRQKIHCYLNSKMNAIAPNLCALTGSDIGARLIYYSGSLLT